MIALRQRAYVEVQEKTLDNGGNLREWVEFSKRKDTKILETTDRVYPGEVVAVERIHDVPDDDIVLHLGLKVELQGWASFGGHGQTTTCFFVKPAPRSPG